MPKFPHYPQPDAMDCGPTCLRMVAKHYGRRFSMPFLREKTEIGKEGVSLLGIAQAAENIGFRTLAVRVTFERLAEEAPLPCIVHWGHNHFVVVYKIKQGRGAKSKGPATGGEVHVADPSGGLLTYTRDEFESRWATTVTDGERTGIALLLETTPQFFEESDYPSPSPPRQGGELGLDCC